MHRRGERYVPAPPGRPPAHPRNYADFTVGLPAWQHNVPGHRTPDGVKSGVTRACYYDPEVNASYAELARHYGTVILPTRAAHPRDKACASDCSLYVGSVMKRLCRRRWAQAGGGHVSYVQ